MCTHWIALSSLRERLDAQDLQAGSRWKRLPQLSDLAPGATTIVDADGTSVLVCRLGSELLAFQGTCVRCGVLLLGARLSARLPDAEGEVVLRCPGCDAHYDAWRGGTLVDDVASHLTPVPLLIEQGVPSVAIGLSDSA